MAKITSERNLEDAIQALEQEREQRLVELRTNAAQLYESVKPANLLRHTVDEITESKDFRQKLLLVGIAIVAGHAAKLLYQRISKSPYKNVIGAVLQFGITNAITHKPEVFGKAGNEALKIVKTLTSENAA